MSEEQLYARPAADASGSFAAQALYRDEAYSDSKLPSARVPHLGHAILFLSFTFVLLLLSQLVALSLTHVTHSASGMTPSLVQPKRELASMAVTYLVALAACFLVFPLFWGRGFLAGVDWRGGKALRLGLRLLSLGLSVGWSVQALSSLIPMPKSIPMDDFFRHPLDVWLVALFGTLLAPLFEEVAFRGFLLPAFSIAFDWLGASWMARIRGGQSPMPVSVFRESAAAGLVPGTGNLYFRSRTALVLASVLSSALFARMHAEQLGYAWAAVCILFGVSLLLSAIRIQTRSLACSVVVHASYNLSVFLTLFLATGGFRHLDKIGR